MIIKSAGERCFILLIIFLLFPFSSFAQRKNLVTEPQENVSGNFRYEQQIYFEVDKAEVYNKTFDNSKAVSSIIDKVAYLRSHDAKDIAISIIASASLEASESHNYDLSSNRTQATLEYLNAKPSLYGIKMEAKNEIYDWTLLKKLTSVSACPYKESVISIIDNPYSSHAEKKRELQKLGKGAAYSFIKEHFFKYMRYANVLVTATLPESEPVQVQNDTILIPFRDTVFMQRVDTVVIEKTAYLQPEKHEFMFAVRSNLLYDIAAVPNIGIDFSLGEKVSLGANWMYSWWKNDPSNFYWRTYGGDVHLDFWFASKRGLKWTGHHAGLYGQMGTFDFELGENGVQGPKWLFGGGLSYGYALYLAPKLSLDFSLGLGYLGGTYYEYSPSEVIVDKYYLENTKQLRYFGPTKAEISLIWKIGRE